MSAATEWVAPYATPEFVEGVNGRTYCLNGFPPRILITRSLLEDPRPGLLDRTGRRLRFRTANGGAWYRLSRRFPHGVFGAERLGRDFPSP